MKLTRLGQGHLQGVAAGIRRPQYDRSRLRPGILHLGAGAFHRCHQAEWTDDALEAEFGDWGIIATNLRAPDLGATLGDQNNLFCRELRDIGVRERRIVGAIVKTHSVLDGGYDPYRLTLARALEDAASPNVRVITMTVTEKGYCHIPATGELNPDHPDIVHDVADPAHPLSAPGFVLRALLMRRERGVPFPTILSCDNVPDNGATLRRCVIGLARLTDPALADHVERHGIFLNTMVDRIVPATRPVDIEGFAAESSILDYGLVVGEPFRMWVIENPTGAGLPPWHRAGAMIVDDVVPFELMKMRVLNGIQTNVSALGLIAGIEFMSDVMGDPAFREFARRTMQREVLPGLPPVPGIDLAGHVEQSIGRLQNPELRHGTAQIVTDGSQKIRQRLLEPIRACLNLGLSCDGLLIGVAAWMQTATGADLGGKPHTAVDPFHAETKAVAERAGSDSLALVRSLLSIRAIFGDDLAGNATLEARLVGYLGQLRERGVAAVIRDHAHGQ